MNEPWSKQHKRVFQDCTYSLSNSFAEPLSQPELLQLTRERGDQSLIDLYHDHALAYTPNGGSADLREEIAKLYGPNIQREHILVFPGGQVALQTAALAFARNAHSIVFTPGYQSTVEAPLWSSNSTITKIERHAGANWQIDIEQVKDAIRDNTRFMILNEPYNPGGIVMRPELQQQLTEIAAQHNIVILCDEVYRLLEHDPQQDRLPAMADYYNKGISAVTMSKPWGGCGIAIGWLACQDLEMKQQLVDVQYFGTACVSRASEIQGMMVLRASEHILDRRLQIIRHNLTLLEAFMEQHQEFFAWNRPNAGAIAFVKFKGPWTSEELGNKMAARSISIKPAYCFTDHVSPKNDYFRVGFGEKKMPQALQAWDAFVEEHKESWKKDMERMEK